MQIIDTFQEISKCYIKGIFDFESWKNYADNIAPGFKEKIIKDSQGYDFQQEVLPILQHLMEHEGKLILAHDTFCEVTAGLEENIRKKLGIELEASIVFYLGLCNGAGWATEINGSPSVLLGVEKIVELSWCDKRNMIALIYHELGHIWHYQIRKRQRHFTTQKDKALWQLYSEGIAMYIEQLLCNEADFYHQDTDGWLNWCNENRKSLYAEFAGRIDFDKSVQDFFGDWCNYQGKSDVGYYLGCELIKSLSEEYSLGELANLELIVVEQKLRELGIKDN